MRTHWGPRRIIKVTHRPDAARKRDPSTGKMKVVIEDGAPRFGSNVPVCSTCHLYVEGEKHITAGKPIADEPPIQADPMTTPLSAHAGYNWRQVARVDAEEYWTYEATHGKAPSWNERSDLIGKRIGVARTPAGDYLRTSGRICLIPEKPGTS